MNFSIENDFLSVKATTAGAELTSIFHKKRQQEFLWQGLPEWWPRRAPVLFPIVGKLNQNSFIVNGKNYSLPQHGFGRDSEFSLFEQTVNSLTFELDATDLTLSKFPFNFKLAISYHLDGNVITTRYTVKNTGTSDLLFSIGGHPGFAFAEGEKLEDYFIEFDKPEKLSRHLISEGVFTGETEPVLNGTILNLTDEQMKKDAIVFKKMQSETITLKSRVSDYSLKFHASGFPYFGIWAKPGGPFVCLEPWCGMADNKSFAGELSLKEGIQSLRPGGVFIREYSVTPG